MDFALTTEEKAFQTELTEFLDTEMPEDWDEPQPDIYAVGRQEMEMRRKFGEKGWRTMAWPKEYGGGGASPVMQLIYKEMISYRGATKIEDQGIDFVGPTIIIHGTEEQKKEHLSRISRGEAFWCQGFSEPEAGSDLAGLQTRAVEDGDDYVINGRKIWTSFAHLATWMHILTRTDPDAPKHRGITYFLSGHDHPRHLHPAPDYHGRKPPLQRGHLRQRPGAQEEHARRKEPWLVCGDVGAGLREVGHRVPGPRPAGLRRRQALRRGNQGQRQDSYR